MKRLLSTFLSVCVLFCCASCAAPEELSEPISDESYEETVLAPDPNAETVWSPICADETNGLCEASDIYRMSYYKNGMESTVYETEENDDVRMLLRGLESTRYVNRAEGYAITVPSGDVEVDLRLGETRTQLHTDVGVLTVTRETENPYSDDFAGWSIYLEEWLEPQLSDIDYLVANNLRYSRQPIISTEMLPGYEVRLYSIAIVLPGDLSDAPFYQVAIVRKTDVYKECFLLMMRSEQKQHEYFDTVIRSFVEFPNVGTPVSTQGQFELKLPENWNDETKAYYAKLQNQNYTDWGFFTRSMVHSSDWSYRHQCETLTETQAFLASENGVEHHPDIMPTYSELTYADVFKPFPTEMANAYAGGNGFNGKPVLQFTLHIGALASSKGEVVETLNVLRGKHDKNLRKLAQDIKAYGHPVLLRVNNEMNGSWTSYNCNFLMMDADLFVRSWRHLYELFEEEGVDNCIWIWNPTAIDAPYGNYNDHLHYFPGSDYVQLIGLTAYEFNNGSYAQSFKEMYTELYYKNIPYFDAFPWVIGEFACGAGGNKKINWDTHQYDDTVLGRNERSQAQWVKEMFSYMNNKNDPNSFFCEKIKFAVWFSVNDSVYIDDKEYVENYLKLNESLPSTLEQFRIGLDQNEELKNAS